MNKIGARIRELRSARSMTQEQLAQKLHVTRQAVSSWENGKTQPDLDTLARLSEALQVSPEELIYGQTQKKLILLPEQGGRFFMSENIGRSIKNAGQAVLIIGCILSLLIGFMHISLLLLVAPVGCLLSWLFSILIYGFGQMVENSDKCVKILTAVHAEPAPPEQTPTPKPLQGPWTCYSCGTTNEGRIGTCVQCGTTRAWSKMKQEEESGDIS